MGRESVADQPSPLALRVVAWLFVLFGLLGIAELLVGLFAGHGLNVHVEAWLSLFVGRGLLAHNRGWRTTGLVLIWISLVGAPVTLIAMAFTKGLSSGFEVLGRSIPGSPPATIAFLASWFGIAAWEYWVLTRPAVRSLFEASA
jgi:hypothetical protein